MKKPRKIDPSLNIRQRPKVVEKRLRLGDYERDSMQGIKGGPVLLTIVDRTSRLTKIAKVEAVNALLTHNKTIQLLQNLPVNTITNDNGSEFASHRYTAEELKTSIYFSDPYASWQRGTNENTNGLIRQYFAKGTDLSKVTDQEIQDHSRRVVAGWRRADPHDETQAQADFGQIRGGNRIAIRELKQRSRS